MLAIATHMPTRNLFGSRASSRVNPGGQMSSPPPGLRELPPPEPRLPALAPVLAPRTFPSEVTVVLIVKPQSLFQSFRVTLEITSRQSTQGRLATKACAAHCSRRADGKTSGSF